MEYKYIIGGDEYTIEEIKNILTVQFGRLFKKRQLDVIEYEYEQDGELFFNILADGHNFIAKINLENSHIYWDKNL